MPTLQELLEQQTALQLALAAHEKPLVEQAAATLTSQPVTDIVAQFIAIRDDLPAGVAKDQIGNVVIVLTSVPSVLTERLTGINAMLPQSPPSPPPPAPGE